MKALTFRGIETIVHESVPDPKILHAEDVILKVERAAICGSDLHPYFGREGGLDSGTVMGHEAVGVVAEVGRSVRGLKTGDRVVMPFSTNCGRCFYCLKGLTCRCVAGHLFGWVEDGKGLHGVQAEYARVPFADATLVKLDAAVPVDAALLLGDVLPTGFFVADQAEVAPGGVYAVVGLGPIGLSAVIAAKRRGGDVVFGIDSVPERLALANSFGATPVSLADEPLKHVRAATEGRGCDAVMDAVGSRDAQRLAFEILRPGGILATAGVHTAGVFGFTPPDAYNKNVTYKVGRCPARRYVEPLAKLLAEGAIDPSPFLSHRLPLAEGAHGYELFAARTSGCTKVILVP